jgi:signal transduction histidine kinase
MAHRRESLNRGGQGAADGESMNRTVKQLVVGFAACTILGLFFATHLYLLFNYLQNVPLTWARAIRSQLVTWYLWGALAIFVVKLARRIPFDRTHIGKALLVHVPTAAIVSVLHLMLSTTWSWAVEGTEHSLDDWLAGLRFLLLVSFHWNVFTYASILAFVHAWDYYQRYRDRELRASRLEAQLVEARLGALEMQLHPHFLFNTLNTIATLIHEDADAADRMVTRLSDLLRVVLRREAGQTVSLAEEIDFVRKYLEIESVRFQDRLEVRWRIDPNAHQATVPMLLLQPLVENAVRHGVAQVDGPCLIEITVRRVDERLHLEVMDNGPGIRDGCDSDHHAGMGLRNTRERLQQLYGCRFSCELEHRPDGGCAARITIPYVTQPVGTAQHGD